MTPLDDLTLLREAGTAAVSDALDLLGVDGGLPGLAPLDLASRAAGPAYPVRFEPAGDGEAKAADYIDDVPPGSVVLLAAGGRTTFTVWGGLLSRVAVRRLLAGTVVDGCCRDVDETLRLGYPLWSAGRYMKSGKGRARMVAANEPVVVRGTPVSPGDVVVADASGVLAVPRGLLPDVLEGVRLVTEREARIATDVDAGHRLDEARARHGYHDITLQRTTP